MYYKLTNISGKNPYFHGEVRRRRIRADRVIRTVRSGQSIVIDEENLNKYRFQNEIARDPNPETWTKYHILLAEPIIPEGKKKGKEKTSKPRSEPKKEEDISQTPESKTPTPIDTKEPQTETEKLEDSVVSQKDESPKASEEIIKEPEVIEKPVGTEEIKESEKSEEVEIIEPGGIDKAEEPEVIEESDNVQESEEVKDESSVTPTAEVKESSAELEDIPQSDDSTSKVTYTVDQLIRKGRGGIHKIKIAKGIKIPGYNSMGVKQRAEFIVKWFEEDQ